MIKKIGLAALAFFVVFSLIKYAVSDIMGVWNKLPSHSQRIWNHQKYLETFHNDLPTMTVRDIKDRLRGKLRYEIAMLQVLGDLMQDLGDKNQLHGGMESSHVNPDPNFEGSV